MPGVKKFIQGQNIAVVATHECVHGVETLQSLACKPDIQTTGFVRPSPGRRIGGKIRLIDLERRASFSRPLSGVA